MPIDVSKVKWDDIDPDKVKWDAPVLDDKEIEKAGRAAMHGTLLGITPSLALDEQEEILKSIQTDTTPLDYDFSQVTEDDFSRSISTITTKPLPTTEEEFAGARAVMNLIPYGFASFYRGMIPKAAEDLIMQPVTKALTGHDYVSPIAEAMKVSGKHLPDNVQKLIGTPAQMAGVILPLSISFKTSAAILKTLGVAEDFLIHGSPLLSKVAYNIFRGGIAGTIYEGLETGQPEEMIKTGAFFAALDGAFGAAAGTIKKISASTWYRKLEVKERGLTIQTADDMIKAGQSEGTILRKLSDAKTREQLFKEAIVKRKIEPIPIKPVVPIKPPEVLKKEVAPKIVTAEQIAIRREKIEPIEELYAKAIEVADIKKDVVEVKRLKGELEFIGGKIETPSEMRKLRQTVHAWQAYKGLTKTKLQSIVKNVTGHLHTTHKDITADQLRAIIKKIAIARPARVEQKIVITRKTENRIIALKQNLLNRGEITEETYKGILDYMRIKEPVYISKHRFVTETQGKEVIDKMLKSVPIAKLNIDQQLSKQPAVKTVIDKLEVHFQKTRPVGKIKVHSLLDMHHFADSMQKQTGAKFGELYKEIRDVKKTTERKVDKIIRSLRDSGGDSFLNITKDPVSVQRINDYVASRLPKYIKAKPEYPKDITADEKNMAENIIAGLKSKETEVRYHRFYEWRDHKTPIPNAPASELRKATEILETQGDEALQQWLVGRSWGIKKTGYDASEVINPTVKMVEIKPGFAKRGLRTSESIVYLKSEKDILKRYASYMRQMTFRTELKPLLDAWSVLFDSNKQLFADPIKMADLLTRNVKELLGKRSELQILDKIFIRAYSQAARTIFLDPRKGVRNLFQNLAFYTDLSQFLKMKKLSAIDKEFFITHVSQMKGIQRDWLYQDYKGIPGFGWLNEMADMVNVMGRTDTINRLAAFRAKLTGVKNAIEKYPNIRTNQSEMEAFLKEIKISDIEPVQRLHVARVLATKGKDAMAREIAKSYTEKIHFLYERFERSPSEQGTELSKILSNLFTFRKGYVQRIVLDARKLRANQALMESEVEGRKQAVKSLVGVAVMGTVASWIYMKLTGDVRDPYRPDKIIGDLSLGGLATGMQEQIGDFTRHAMEAATGDKDSLSFLINDIAKAGDNFIPFYNDVINIIEGLTDFKGIDKMALRKLREAVDKRYKARPPMYYDARRTTIEAAQHALFGTEPEREMK